MKTGFERSNKGGLLAENENGLFSYFPKNLLIPLHDIYCGGDSVSAVELTKMSSRGQIVIPQDIRKELGLREGEAFAVVASGDALLLKRVQAPTKEEILKEWQKITAESRKQAKKLGIKQKDVSKIVHELKGIK